MGKGDAPTRPLSAAERWTAWELDVLADGSTVAPLEVEQAAAAGGWPWRSWRVSDADLVKLDGSRWEWSTACAWGASLTRAKAAEGVAAFGKWRGREWRNLVARAIEGRTPGRVEAELCNALTAGTVRAWGFEGSRAVTIPAAEWPALEWRRDAHGEALEFDELLLFGEVRYRRVTVSRADAMRLWPARDGWAPAEVSQADPPGADGGVAGTVEDAPVAGAAPIDVEFREVAESALTPAVVGLPGPPADLSEWEKIGAAVAQISPGMRREKKAKGSRKLIGRPFKEELERVLGHRVTVAQADKAWALYDPNSFPGRPSKMPRTNATE